MEPEPDTAECFGDKYEHTNALEYGKYRRYSAFPDGFGRGAVIKRVFRSRMVWNRCLELCRIC